MVGKGAPCNSGCGYYNHYHIKWNCFDILATGHHVRSDIHWKNRENLLSRDLQAVLHVNENVGSEKLYLY